jgi:isopentenyl-diphosphate Delta-isomerase
VIEGIAMQNSDIMVRDANSAKGGEILIPAIATDDSLYPIEKLEAHRLGQLHLAISAFVFSRGRLLIQRRALSKYHCPGMWANTVCTHPHWGEAPDAAAQRRLMEELGFSIPLTEQRIVEYRADVGQGLTEHERVHMYTADVDESQLVIAPNPDEVMETRWASAAELRREIDHGPEAFTPWFRIYLRRFPDLILA